MTELPPANPDLIASGDGPLRETDPAEYARLAAIRDDYAARHPSGQPDLLTKDDLTNIKEVLDSQIALGHAMTLMPTDVLDRLYRAAPSGQPNLAGADVEAVIEGLGRAIDWIKPEPGMDGPHGGHIGGVTRQRAVDAIEQAIEFLRSRSTAVAPELDEPEA